MTRDEHARFEELAAGHALSALEPGDEEVFLAHLPSCAACERAVAEHRETASHLAYAADPVALPDSLLDRIRAEVQATGRAMPPPAPVSLDAARTRRRAPLPPAWTAVAAAVALVLSLGVWNVSLRQGRSDLEQRADRLAAAVQTLEIGTRVPLADGSGRPVAVAVLHDDRVSLVVDGLAANDRSTSTYVLWQTGATGTRAVAAFDVRGEAVDVVRDLPLVTTLKGWTALAVTREPGRTAPEVPGSMPVANGTVPA
jgi:anti-sigma factor RsiW